MVRILTHGDEQIWRRLPLEAIELQPECFVTTADEERAIPLSWFRAEIVKRYALTEGEDAGLAVLKVEDGLGYISSMFVRPNALLQGIADKLLNYLRKCAKDAGCHSMILQVFGDNDAAINLYRKHGFEIESTKPFGDRVDCRMITKLDDS